MQAESKVQESRVKMAGKAQDDADLLKDEKEGKHRDKDLSGQQPQSVSVIYMA